jgi:hypothetical protein
MGIMVWGRGAQALLKVSKRDAPPRVRVFMVVMNADASSFRVALGVANTQPKPRFSTVKERVAKVRTPAVTSVVRTPSSLLVAMLLLMVLLVALLLMVLPPLPLLVALLLVVLPPLPLLVALFFVSTALSFLPA